MLRTCFSRESHPVAHASLEFLKLLILQLHFQVLEAQLPKNGPLHNTEC